MAGVTCSSTSRPAPTGPRPLVLALPGAGQTGARLRARHRLQRLADREGFLVAYPTAAGARSVLEHQRAPRRPDDVAYLRPLARPLDGAPPAPTAAASVVTGVSNGGGHDRAARLRAADRLAGVARSPAATRSLPPCRPQRPLPVLEIHGTADHVVPYNGKAPDQRGQRRRAGSRSGGGSTAATGRRSGAAGAAE